MTRVTGIVRGSDGRPVRDAVVQFVAGPGSWPDTAQLTGPDGQFSLAAPARGPYRVQVNAPGHEAVTVDFDVADEIEIAQDVALP